MNRRSPARRLAMTCCRALVACLCASGMQLAGATAEKAASYYEDALKRYEKRDLEGAVIQLKNSLKEDNKLLAAHMLLGRALFRLGDLNGAEVAYEEALKLGVNRGEVAIALGRIFILTGRPDRIIERFAATGLPRNLEARVLSMRGNAYFEMGNSRLALRSYDEAKTADPTSPVPWTDSVPVLLSQGEKERAKEAAAKAVQLGPEDGDAWNMHASVMHSMLDMKGALAAYDKAIALETNHLDARVARAAILVDLQRIDDARKEIARILEISAGEPRALYLQALVASRNGDRATMSKALGDAAHTIDAFPPQMLYRREQLLMIGALAHSGLGNTQKAREYLEVIVTRNPSNVAARKLLATIFVRARDFARAEPHLQLLQRAIPGDPQVLFMLGSWQLSLRRYVQASDYLERAATALGGSEVNRALAFSQFGLGKGEIGLVTLEKAYAADPEDVETGTMLAMLYGKRGQAAKALKVAEAMVQKDPRNLTALNFLAAVKQSLGDRAGARKAFEQVIAADPLFRPAVLNLARLDIAEGKLEPARQRLTSFLAKTSDDNDALYELGMLERRANRPDEAVRSFKKAMDSLKPDVRSGLALIDLQLSMRRFDDAIETAKAIASKFPESISAQIGLGRAYLAAGDAKGARGPFQDATKLAQFNADLLVGIGRLQLAAGNPDGAAYCVQKALQGQPDHLGTLALSVDVEVGRRDMAKADAAAKVLASKYPDRAETYLATAAVALGKGQFAVGATALRTALAKKPNSAIAVGLASALSMAGESGKAIESLESWLKTHPRDGLALKALAETQQRAGRLQAARQNYARFIAAFPEDAEATNNYANVLFLLGDKGALALAERAAKLAPTNAGILDTYGWLLVREGRPEDGLRFLRDARLRSPGNAEIRFHLAYALNVIGKKTEAKDELLAALGQNARLSQDDDVIKLKKALGI